MDLDRRALRDRIDHVPTGNHTQYVASLGFARFEVMELHYHIVL
jgi:hypothetical protein